MTTFIQSTPPRCHRQGHGFVVGAQAPHAEKGDPSTLGPMETTRTTGTFLHLCLRSRWRSMGLESRTGGGQQTSTDPGCDPESRAHPASTLRGRNTEEPAEEGNLHRLVFSEASGGPEFKGLTPHPPISASCRPTRACERKEKLGPLWTEVSAPSSGLLGRGAAQSSP